MGRKVHPKVYRLGTIYQSNSRWYSPKGQYADLLEEDTRIRELLERRLRGAGLARVEIERHAGSLKIIIHTSKTGMVIGRGGKGIEALKKEIQDQVGGNKPGLDISIQEVARPELDATLVAQGVAEQLEKRIPFRRAVKRTLEQVMSAGADGVKVIVAGRLNGAEIARSEKFQQGKLPLQTIRADIDYGHAVARTTYGTVGVKAWIYKGEVFEKESEPAVGTPVAAKRKQTPRT